MKYNKEQRLEIGRRIYRGELNVAMAANEYDVNLYTARDYLRLYKAHIHVAIPQKHRKNDVELAQYERMTREELIDVIMASKINEVLVGND